MSISNLQFPYAMVSNLTALPLLLDNTKKITDLAVGQIGAFYPTTGLGATQAGAAGARTIFFAQNLGPKFGVVRTKPIDRTKIIRYYGQSPVAAVNQTTYLGYDTTGTYTSPTNDTRKGFRVSMLNKEVVIPITIYYRPLSRWYGSRSYHHRIVINLANCACIADPCALYADLPIAQAIADYINNVGVPVGGFPATHELGEYLTASVVQNGDGGAGGPIVAGVKIDAKPVAVDLNDICYPNQYYEAKWVHFVVGSALACGTIPATTTVVAKPPQGVAPAVRELELEAQGYDVARDSFDHPKYMKLANYKSFTVDGITYDGYFIAYDWEHDTSSRGATNGLISERYLLQIYANDGSGTALEAFLNAWIGPEGYTAVDV